MFALPWSSSHRVGFPVGRDHFDLPMSCQDEVPDLSSHSAWAQFSLQSCHLCDLYFSISRACRFQFARTPFPWLCKIGMAHRHRTSEININKNKLYDIVCISNHTLIFRLLHCVLQDVRPRGLTCSGAKLTKLSRRILLFLASLTDAKRHSGGFPRN